MMKPIKTKPAPFCDECGCEMVLRRPKEGQTWEPFWGCRNYPECDFTLNIGDDGEPMYREDYEDYGIDYYDFCD